MTCLSWTFGAPISDEQPLLDALRVITGRSSRVRRAGPLGEAWFQGSPWPHIEDEDVLGPHRDVCVTLRGDNETIPLRLPTDKGGVVEISDPRYRRLTVITHFGAADETQVDFFDARPVTAIDRIERDLLAAMSEPDPMRRFDRVVAMREAVTVMGDAEPDDHLRARLVALSVFLEEYRDPRSAGGDGT